MRRVVGILFLLVTSVSCQQLNAQTDSPAGVQPLALYQSLARFELAGGSAHAENAVLRRDRAEITFDGDFYFERPLAGRIRGAVFIGRGRVHADCPPIPYEKDSLRRMLKADAVESDFRTAVLRFTDDTIEALGLKISPEGVATDDARKLAAEHSRRLLRETGANLPARLTVSIVNQETPGLFLAEFEKGSLGRFTFLFDPQNRLPQANFGLDGGEKGLFFAYDDVISYPDIWMAFWALEDYQRGRVPFSDAYELVTTRRHDMEIDVRDWKHMRLRSHMQLTSNSDGIRAIPFMLNETLGNYEDARLKKALRLKSARMADGSELTAVQEEWDGSVTLLLPSPLAKGQTIEPVLEFEGEFLRDPITGGNVYYLRSDCWYLRHGNLDRSLFDLTFRHKKGTRVVSEGLKVREGPAPEGDLLTEWKIDNPVALMTFAVGDFNVAAQTISMESGAVLPLDFYYPPAGVAVTKPDFILNELSNAVRYFVALFGTYPYPRLGAVFHPYHYGQGFATLLRIPNAAYNDEEAFRFLAHETSHQWWGNIVSWRSYHDQWLSEGFAEYSGILFAGRHSSDKNAVRTLLHREHDQLMASPETRSGIGKGRVAEVGPIILGHRLATREGFNAYYALTYAKGAFVLRMLHFLLSNVSTGDGNPFFEMMQDFARRYANRAASTEAFMAVASEHFAKSPTAQKYKLRDLNWFFDQWVYQSALPSYSLRYTVENQPDGSALVRGVVSQKNAGEKWFMPLPLVIELPGGQVARGTVAAFGPENPFVIRVSAPPTKVTLDPDEWVLSEHTTTTSGK